MLDSVRQFVRNKAFAAVGPGHVAVRRKHDVGAERVCIRAHGLGGLCGLGIGVNAYPAEVVPEALFHGTAGDGSRACPGDWSGCRTTLGIGSMWHTAQAQVRAVAPGPTHACARPPICRVSAVRA